VEEATEMEAATVLKKIAAHDAAMFEIPATFEMPVTIEIAVPIGAVVQMPVAVTVAEAITVLIEVLTAGFV
jgi:hypothetical protein